MRDVMTMLPIYLFMLIPVWIPLIAVTVGALVDLVRAPGRVAHRASPARVSGAGRPVPAAGSAR